MASERVESAGVLRGPGDTAQGVRQLASEVPKPSRNRRRTSCSTGAAALSHALSHSLSHSLGRMTCGSPARAGDLGRRAGRATCAVGGEILYLIIKIKSSIFAV